MNSAKSRFILCIILALVIIPNYTLGKNDSNLKPTAIVIDAETNEPIQGAMAIAIWREHSSTKRSWWGGGTTVVTRTEESISDKDGQLFIPDYWSSGGKVHLTAYKYGYICWDQEHIYQQSEWRTNFDTNNRIIHLERWPSKFSHKRHWDFIRQITQRDIPKDSTFKKEFNTKELPLVSIELDKNN